MSSRHATIDVHQPTTSTGHKPNVRVRRAGPWDLSSGMLKIPAGYGNDSRWLSVLQNGLQQQPLRLEAERDGDLVGVLPLVLVQSRLFGRFLVSLPYLNTAGVIAADRPAAVALLDRAVALCDEYNVRYLELRQETAFEHPGLNFQRTDKVHMRLDLPDSTAQRHRDLKSSVRSQIRKGESYGLEIRFGGEDLLPEFYRVFSCNMRDLGTPVYGRSLFRSVLSTFGSDAELCVVRYERQPVAAALLIHSDGVTQVPSASSLRHFNRLNANMVMYWHLQCRAIERGSRLFDFGRSSVDSGTFRFKKQWGATPQPSVWQYHVRQGDANAMRPDSTRNQRLIRLWQRLPLWLANTLGPGIIRGIP